MLRLERLNVLTGCLRKESPSGEYRELEVFTEFASDKDILLMPSGTVSIHHMPAGRLSLSRMGAAIVEGGPRIASTG